LEAEGHHTIDQQVSGWLLHDLDRLQVCDMVGTQELIASMLNVRCENATKAAGQLQDAGLIHFTRGHIGVLDLVGLERRSRESHAVVRKEYDRLLPPEPSARPADPGRRPCRLATLCSIAPGASGKERAASVRAP